MIATEAIIQSLALSGMPPNMLPLEGETLTPDDIDLFERAQAAQANKPFVPTLAAPSGDLGNRPAQCPRILLCRLFRLKQRLSMRHPQCQCSSLQRLQDFNLARASCSSLRSLRDQTIHLATCLSSSA